MSGVKVTNRRPAHPIPETEDVDGVTDVDDNVDWDPTPGSAPGSSELDQWKQPVIAATTASITIATALNAGDTIDGVLLAAGNRVLVKDQSSAAQNGIYVVGSSPERAVDMDEDDEVLGAVVYVIGGTANTGTAWKVTNTAATIVGTDAINWAAFGGSGSSLTVKDEGTPLATAATSLDFVGAGVTASGIGAAKTITIPGGIAGIAATEDGVSVVATATTIDARHGLDVTAPGGGVARIAVDESELVVEDIGTGETDIALVLAPDGAGGLVFRAESTASGFLTKVSGEGHTVSTHGSMGSTETLDLAAGNVQTGTLNAACTITLTGWPAAGTRGVMQVQLLEDGTGGWVPTFSVSGTLVWMGGSAPVHDTTASSASEYIFWSDDAGTTVYGGMVGSLAALSPSVLILPGATSPAQTAEGSAVWDTDDDVLTVGTGLTRKTFGYLGTTTPVNTGSASNGSGNEVARANHDHGITAGGGGTTVQGRLPFAYMIGGSPASSFATTTSFAAGGAWAVPVVIAAPMYLDAVRVRNGDTATARSFEWRLFKDSGSTTMNEVSGANGSASFTPSAASDRDAAATGAPVTLDPGLYWLVVRNNHASNAFTFVYTATGGTNLTNNPALTGTPGALTTTIDISAFTKQSRIYAVILLGRIWGQSTALYASA